METIILPCKNATIKYNLRRKDVKNINIYVNRNGEVFVSANYSVPQDLIDKFIIKKNEWILRHQNKFKNARKNALNTIEKQYISGESFVFMGNKYILKVQQSQNEGVEIKGSYINLFIKNEDAQHKKKSMILNWYSMQTMQTLESIFIKTCQKYDIKTSCQLIIRKMKSRWGSCNITKNRVTLNSKLIYTPESCIEYVILHELCHFEHPNHSKDYYQLLERMMPDWKARKRALDRGTIIN